MSTNQKKKTSVEELKVRAEAGDVEAQSALGLFYELGIEVSNADPKEAAKWWGKAAKLGNTTAQFSLAEIISKDFEDTEENRAMAQALYTKAESAGLMPADKALRLLGKDSGQGWSVLVVDDAATVRIALKSLLEGEGCDVVEAADGQEAIQKMHKHPNIKMILTDLNMPILDGFAFIKIVRANEKWSHLPVIVMTTESSPETIAIGKQLHVNGWIVKPARPQIVRRYLSKLSQHAIKNKLKSAS